MIFCRTQLSQPLCVCQLPRSSWFVVNHLSLLKKKEFCADVLKATPGFTATSCQWCVPEVITVRETSTGSKASLPSYDLNVVYSKDNGNGFLITTTSP